MKRTKSQRRSPDERDGHQRSFVQKELTPEALEPVEIPRGEVSRRRFLALLGASAGLAGAACSRPGQDDGVVPYSQQPEETVPGVVTTYATSYSEAGRAHSVLVKTREARPIHLEGNGLSSGGARAPITARGQAQILSLFDPDRVSGPLLDGAPASWDESLSRILSAVRGAQDRGRTVVLLTGAVSSPTVEALIQDLATALPAFRHVAWEPSQSHTVRAAHSACFGGPVTLRSHLEQARIILSLGHDFLGDGNDADLIQAFARGRVVRDRHDSMSRLYTVEGRRTLTGNNADQALRLRPSRTAELAFGLVRALAEKGVGLPDDFDAGVLSGFDLDQLVKSERLDDQVVAGLVDDLAGHRGASVVLAGPELPAEAHSAVSLLNEMLGAHGSTLSREPAAGPELATYKEMDELAAEMAGGDIGAALLWNVNPLYSFPGSPRWKDALEQVPLRAQMALRKNETSEACQLFLPVHHWLESWGDHRSNRGTILTQQPVLRPLHDTRQGEDVLLALLQGVTQGENLVSPTYRDYLRDRWQQDVFPEGSLVSFEAFWNASLHDGSFRRRPGDDTPELALVATAVAEAASRSTAASSSPEWELVLHPDSRVFDGRDANIGWLQELPDPVTKVVWSNALAISPEDALQLGISDGDEMEVAAGGVTVLLPALVQPGQARGVVSTALGFGRRSGSVAQGAGVDTYPLIPFTGDGAFLRHDVTIRRTGSKAPLVKTQEHHRLEGRDLARSLVLSSYAAHAEEHHAHHPEGDLFEPLEFPVHQWRMVIDMNACVGCSACVVACQSENNIPVVGPEQVRKGREMHWIRLDRYYEGPAEEPLVVHQPMLCQHCDQAPCENVCPVNATTHSAEGLNQMAYNRCVGTRYCANNCPYKVRRFNFFDFHEGNKTPMELAFNPEVSIRPRGVMEKCTFCIQRIENGKQEAKAEGRKPRDGEIQTACQVACPAKAIVFGDLNDKEAQVTDLWKNDRGFRVLEADLGVGPGIVYLAKLRNQARKGEPHES